jgi:hypothetical protein
MVQAPVRYGETRIYQNDVGQGISPKREPSGELGRGLTFP